MAQADWQGLLDNAATNKVDHGVTAGTTKPSGGGLHVYAFRSLEAASNIVALHAGQVNFNPMLSGGSVRAALRRDVGRGYSPFIFMCLQGTGKADGAYMLGLSDADPYRIVLRKGDLDSGIPDGGAVPATAPNILMRSTQAFADQPWLHLRLDAIVQGTGDVIVQVFQNDLLANPVSAPVWVNIPGMEGPQAPTIAGFVDDALGINSGSLPFTAGRGGFGFKSTSIGSLSYVDNVEVARQV